MNTIRLRELLSNTVGCVLEPLDALLIDKYRERIPFLAPRDLVDLFSDYKKVEIFVDDQKIPPNSNSWNLQPGFFTTSPTIASFFGPPLPEDEYMAEYHEKFYRLGHRASDGAHIIGISCHPESVGIMFDYYVDCVGAPLGLRKIANTFTEWIERTLAAGPDGEIYWFKSDFIDLGPAVPNDPYYEP
jgi:hypothetical protein